MVWEVQTPGKNEVLIENELYRGNRLFCGDRFRGKKERSRNLNKTVIIMLASFYQNFLEKYLNKAQLITLKMLVGVVATKSKTSEDRKTGSDPTVTNTTKHINPDVSLPFLAFK
ncbi:hypothetical protein IQ244_16885 [Nostoc sp. LEGE 06077]|uniref:hypothetical protein n=1 Tax=Nostoc sp. LEGE 06077 TaxID=915325 RepID=UPI001880FE63|nr:hypothetical protein [Nostoc sp. LEGE 06077]MBE9208174.1 hypothetical protein [Nostoc sp. LEGE 06077]